MTAGNRQPSLDKQLVLAAEDTVRAIDLSHQDAAVWVHAAAVAQHAVQVGLASDGRPFRDVIDEVAGLHPGLSLLGDLPAVSSADERVIRDLWSSHELIDAADSHVLWWSYPLGDLYQTLSTESRKGRALCQTPWWVGELLLHMSLDRAKELWDRPRVIDPSCGTGHLLLESYFAVLSGFGNEAERLALVHGVDLDPYAATITRYRLLVMAWAQIQHRHDRSALADLPLQVVAADALLTDDEPLLDTGQYHVVVGNPPYITVKDNSTSAAVRVRYPEVCRGQYSLALPFHALMMRLLVQGGWCAQLTANSFMKREFGRRYVEKWLTQFDLQWVIDTSGAYIPGHGTPTVIMVHRNQAPQDAAVRAILGKQGEPGQPADSSKGQVWTAIADAVRARESTDRFVRHAEAAQRRDHPSTLDVAEARVQPIEKPTQGTLFELMGDVA